MVSTGKCVCVCGRWGETIVEVARRVGGATSLDAAVRDESSAGVELTCASAGPHTLGRTGGRLRAPMHWIQLLMGAPRKPLAYQWLPCRRMQTHSGPESTLREAQQVVAGHTLVTLGRSAVHQGALVPWRSCRRFARRRGQEVSVLHGRACSRTTEITSGISSSLSSGLSPSCDCPSRCRFSIWICSCRAALPVSHSCSASSRGRRCTGTTLRHEHQSETDPV